jgi:hypothetical protein
MTSNKGTAIGFIILAILIGIISFVLTISNSRYTELTPCELGLMEWEEECIQGPCAYIPVSIKVNESCEGLCAIKEVEGLHCPPMECEKSCPAVDSEGNPIKLLVVNE